MKNRKCLVVFAVFLGCILIFAFTANLVNKRSSIDDLMSQLEKSINSSDLKSIVDLYPDYYRNTISDLLSQDKLNEFNSKIGDIEINIVSKTNYDLSEAKDIQNRIGLNLKIEDYQIAIINVTNNAGSVFEQTQLQVIKIHGKYYLYTEYYLGDLIQCFVE
ncbi:MAG: hypothetical protein K2N01_04295 [Lachnospiraceae bacterium]|nr:hypothetical protein [Lachnospiraceae bacterium]